jgi:hypothetical protein
MQSADYLRLVHGAREIASAKCIARALSGRTRTNRCAPASRGLACRPRAVPRPQRDRLRFETWRSVDRKQLRRKRKERPSPPACRSYAFIPFPALLSPLMPRRLCMPMGQTRLSAFGSIYRLQIYGFGEIGHFQRLSKTDESDPMFGAAVRRKGVCRVQQITPAKTNVWARYQRRRPDSLSGLSPGRHGV